MNRGMMYTAVYHVVTTFFDNRVLYKTYNEEFASKEELESCLNELEKYSLNYGLTWLWKNKKIFSVRIRVIINGVRYLDKTINIVQIKISNQLKELSRQFSMATDRFTKKRLLKGENILNKEMEEAKKITLDYFREHYLDSDL